MRQSLLCRNCIRYLAIIEIVDSHAIQIHCADTVIVRLVAAVLTGKQMYLLVAICLFCVSTDGTALAGIPRVDLDYGRLVLFRLIEELLFEVVESPRYRNIAIVNLFSVNSNIITVLDFVLLLRKLQNMRN